jgi:hypothetical protein
MEDDNFEVAIEKTRAELAEMVIASADAKAERRAIRQAINGGNAIVQVIESYHGFSWADEIGSNATQETVNKLVKRGAWLDREIARFKNAIKIMTKNLEIYDANDDAH